MAGSSEAQDWNLQRRHDSLLASAEKKLLIYLAKRTPESVSADHYTILGVIGGAVSGLGCVAANWDIRFLWVAAAGLGINWFGDSLDGSLARVRKCERPRYGFFLDQMCDVASHYMLLIGMALSPLMHSWSALLALLGSMLVMFYQQLKLRFEPVWQVSHLGWGPTETRLALIVGFIAVARGGQLTFVVRGEAITVFDAIATLVFVAAVIGVTLSFFKERGRFELQEQHALGRNRGVKPVYWASAGIGQDDAETLSEPV